MVSPAASESWQGWELKMNQAVLKLVGKEDGDKQKALDAALAQIDRAFGKGSVMKLGKGNKLEIETISTGSLGLDLALGVGGVPRGRVIEIFGPESSGKTTLALHIVARSAEGRRRGGLHRRRARAGPVLRRQARGQPRRPPGLAARHGRAGAGDHRHPWCARARST